MTGQSSTPDWRDVPLTLADFTRVPWVQVIASVAEGDCDHFSTALLAKAREAEDAGDRADEATYRLLSVVTMIHLRAEDQAHPFHPPEWVQNISDTHLEILSELIPAQGPALAADCELRARLADILFVRRRNFRCAPIAVEAYRESAQRLLGGSPYWILARDRLRRALHIAVLLGRAPGSLFAQVVAEIESILTVHAAGDTTFLSAGLMEVLLEQRQGDPNLYASSAEHLARQAEAAGDGHRAREYWELAGKWHLRRQNQASHDAAWRAIAETYVRTAEASVQQMPPDYLRATFDLQSAIAAMRRAAGTQARVAHLHQLLLDYQRQSVTQFTPIQVAGDTAVLEEMAQHARQAVQGKSMLEALPIVAHRLVQSPSVAKMEVSVEQHLGQSPFHLIYSGVLVNDQGRWVARTPGQGAEESSADAALRRRLKLEEAQRGQSLRVRAVILPAIQQLTLEQPVRRDDLRMLVASSPLVPPGREEIVARGLQAGLDGDWLVAAHLLVPQLEEALRHLLLVNGAIPFGLDDEGIQDSHLLGTVLYRDELKEMLGEDTVFDLQGLLVERHGSNLRNRLAHGLMEPGDFWSDPVVYLWWLFLRLCLAAVRVVPHDQDGTSSSPSSPLTSELDPSSPEA